jgi:hypothetical protein
MYKVVVDKFMDYNRVIEMSISSQNTTFSSNTDDMNTLYAITCSQFLQQTSSQVTSHGLNLILKTLPNMNPAVFFRNNHFSTIIKSNDKLWVLVTDEGFLDLTEIVWESVTLNGNSEFVDSYFNVEAVDAKPDDDADLALAIMLQDEENAKVYNDLDVETDNIVVSSVPVVAPQEKKKRSDCIVQ